MRTAVATRTASLATLATLVAGATCPAQPIGSTITYQGQVTATPGPLGPVDLRFRLFDAAAAGSPVGPLLSVPGLATTPDGRFTTALDFGGTAFAGNRRWVQIEVAPAGTGDYTTLSPRQELTAAPYALYATSAGNAAMLNGQGAAFYSSASNLSAGTLPDARLAGAYTAALSLTNAGNIFGGNGALLTGLSATNLASGVVPSARLAGVYSSSLTFSNAANTFVGNGAGLTGLSAANVTIGTLADARLSANIPRLDALNTFAQGIRFADGSIQTTAALDPGITGVLSGYAAGSTVAITINGMSFPSARLAGEMVITQPIDNTTGLPSGQRRLTSGLTVQRQRTADPTWYNWARLITGLSGAVVTLSVPGGSVTWTFGSGAAINYTLRLGDDGVPVEEITYQFDASQFPQRQVTGTIPQSTPTLGIRRGFKSGNPVGTTFRPLINSARHDFAAVVDDTQWTNAVDVLTGQPTGQVMHGRTRLRVNGSDPTLFPLWASLNPFAFGLAIHPTAGPDIVVTPAIPSTRLTLFSLRPADDGLPIEEYGVFVPRP